MVEQKIKQLFNTKTILHIDNPEHYDIILPLTTLNQNHYKEHVNRGDFCINFDSYNSWARLKWYKEHDKYNSNNYKIITSTELIGNTIYELW